MDCRQALRRVRDLGSGAANARFARLDERHDAIYASRLIQDGRYSSGDKTRLYLGRSTRRRWTTTEDSGGGDYADGRQAVPVEHVHTAVAFDRWPVFDSAAWNYASTTYRQANNASGNKVEFIVGLAEDEVSASALLDGYVASNYFSMSVGIGVDSTTTNSAYIGYPFTALSSSQFTLSSVGTYRGFQGRRHYLARTSVRAHT